MSGYAQAAGPGFRDGGAIEGLPEDIADPGYDPDDDYYYEDDFDDFPWPDEDYEDPRRF
jgi:hypothetical protein